MQITLITSNEYGAGTTANFYMKVFGASGYEKAFALPKPLLRGSTVTFTSQANPTELSGIGIKCFSIDTWQFEAIEIVHKGVTYTFTNPSGKRIDRFDGFYFLTPDTVA